MERAVGKNEKMESFKLESLKLESFKLESLKLKSFCLSWTEPSEVGKNERSRKEPNEVGKFRCS